MKSDPDDSSYASDIEDQSPLTETNIYSAEDLKQRLEIEKIQRIRKFRTKFAEDLSKVMSTVEQINFTMEMSRQVYLENYEMINEEARRRNYVVMHNYRLYFAPSRGKIKDTCFRYSDCCCCDPMCIPLVLIFGLAGIIIIGLAFRIFSFVFK